jgi:hypothetical protein
MLAMTLLFAGIMGRIRMELEKRIPVGYQDENGFHVGTESTLR